MSGWFKIHRKLGDSELWTKEPFTRGQAWVDLIMLANYKDGFIFIRGNEVTVKRGQVGWSERRLSKRWSWSRGKLRRYMKWLKGKENIVQQKNNVTSLITIINYEQYQMNDTADSTTDGPQTVPQTDRRRYPNKKDKKNKKEKKVKNKDTVYTPPYQEIIDDLNQKTGQKYKATTLSTQKLIKARFNEGFTFDDFVIVHSKKYEDWIGTKWAKFLRPETLYSNKFEGYLNQAEESPFSETTTKNLKTIERMFPNEKQRPKKILAINGNNRHAV